MYDPLRDPEQVYESMKIGNFKSQAANMEIIKYNIEKLGGYQSTLESRILSEVRNATFSYEL